MPELEENLQKHSDKQKIGKNLYCKLSQNAKLELEIIIKNAQLANLNDRLLVRDIIIQLGQGFQSGYSIIGSVFSDETKKFLEDNNCMKTNFFAFKNWLESIVRVSIPNNHVQNFQYRKMEISPQEDSSMLVFSGNTNDQNDRTTRVYQIR